MTQDITSTFLSLVSVGLALLSFVKPDQIPLFVSILSILLLGFTVPQIDVSLKDLNKKIESFNKEVSYQKALIDIKADIKEMKRTMNKRGWGRQEMFTLIQVLAIGYLIYAIYISFFV